MRRKTQRKRIARKLNELRRNACRRMHESLADQYRWHASVLRGHIAYYGTPHNWRETPRSHPIPVRLYLRSKLS